MKAITWALRPPAFDPGVAVPVEVGELVGDVVLSPLVEVVVAAPVL
jgi:hypothetical protein